MRVLTDRGIARLYIGASSQIPIFRLDQRLRATAMYISQDLISHPFHSSCAPLIHEQVSGHLLNSVFALFEVVFARTERPPWIHLPFLIVFLGGYLSIAYITYATQGFYTYDFLDPATGKGMVAAYCFGIAAAICIVFVVAWLLIWARLAVTEKLLNAKGKFSSRDRGRLEEGKGAGAEVSKV